MEGGRMYYAKDGDTGREIRIEVDKGSIIPSVEL